MLNLAVGEYAGGQGFPPPKPVSMRREYSRLRLRIGRCMQKLQKRRYLARDIKALRCRIRFNPESIRGAVAQTISRVIPMAIRTSLARTAMAMVAG